MVETVKNILVVDDSALMRRVFCDIIEADARFHVQDRAVNGLEALNLLARKTYDAVVLDVNMPQMNGLELLRQLQKREIAARVVMASTDTSEGAQVTLDALDLGALDFIHKPGSAMDCRNSDFGEELLRILAAVTEADQPPFRGKAASAPEQAASGSAQATSTESQPAFVASLLKSAAERAEEKAAPEPPSGKASPMSGSQIVALASSTGGPKALQSVIPKLPANLSAPVVIVQHMPAGFTASLAERLDSLSKLHVKEAEEGEAVSPGNVYIARGGKHLNIVQSAGKSLIHYTDEPNREGVKPCANYMYESLMDSRYDRALCVVMTGMGADGTQGIQNLKQKKKVHVIVQDAASCAVYGMPKSVVNAGLSDQMAPLERIAQEIITNVGVK